MYGSKYYYECNRRNRQEWNKNYYSNSGKFPKRKWSTEDEQEIIISELPDAELSETLRRSVKSIQVRRSRIISEGRAWLKPEMVVRKSTPVTL